MGSEFDGGRRRWIPVGILALAALAVGLPLAARAVLGDEGAGPAILTGTETAATPSTQPEAGDETPSWEVLVFVQLRVTEAQRAALVQMIEEDPDVARYYYVDKLESRAEFERMFSDDPEKLDQLSDNPDVAPTSYRLVPATKDGKVIQGLIDQFSAGPGVQRVVWANAVERQAPIADAGSGTHQEGIIVFLRQEVTDADRAALVQMFEENPEVASYRYVDEVESLAEVERLFHDNQAMLDHVHEHPEMLPTSYRVVPSNDDRDAIMALTVRLEGEPGVLRASSSVETMERLIEAIERIAGTPSVES